MATCKRNSRTIDKQFKTTNVILDLTAEEAYFLQMILSSIGGHPESSPRKFQTSIHEALKNAGINFHALCDNRIKIDTDHYCGSYSGISFKNETLNNFIKNAINVDNLNN